MFNELIGYYNLAIANLSGGDPVAKGLVTVWLLSTLTYIARGIPAKVLGFLKLHTLVSVTIINDSDAKTAALFANIQKWMIGQNRFTLRDRSLAINEESEEMRGMAYGNHTLLIGNRLFRVSKLKESASPASKVIEILKITTIGRDPGVFDRMVEACSVDKNIRYYWDLASLYSSDAIWGRRCEIKPTPRIFIDPAVRAVIDKHVTFFRDNRQWYADRDIPYKLTILLYGPPGTGKSSIIRYISDLLNSDIYEMDIGALQTRLFLKAMMSFRKGVTSVVTLEDFENFAMRKKAPKLVDADGIADDIPVEPPRRSDISAFLNTLQGIVPLDNVVTVMTTNHLELVDPAIYRKGRTDLMLEIGPLGITSVRDYFEYNYKQEFPKDIAHIDPIKACDMEGLFKDNPFEPAEFVEGLREKYMTGHKVIPIMQREAS